jgi:hypothetical protein
MVVNKPIGDNARKGAVSPRPRFFIEVRRMLLSCVAPSSCQGGPLEFGWIVLRGNSPPIKDISPRAL